MNYARHYNPARTSQAEPIPGREKEMVQNLAGGHVFKVDHWVQLERFMILGGEGGTYYATERELTIDNAQSVVKCIKEDPKRVMDVLLDVRANNRAPKLKPLFFVLALLCTFEDSTPVNPARSSVDGVVQGGKQHEYRGYGYSIMPQLCRTASHLFEFVSVMDSMRGWGTGFRNAIIRWYRLMDREGGDKLAYQVTKYRQRAGWTHRDLLRKCKPKPITKTEDAVYAFCAGRDWRKKTLGKVESLIPLVQYEMAQVIVSPKSTRDVADTVNLINKGLPWECIQSSMMKSVKVNEALMANMPTGALVRQLGRLGAIECLNPMSKGEAVVLSRMTTDSIQKAELHPIQLLAALLTYGSGHGARGKLSWEPNQAVVDAIDAGFHAAFGNIKPTDKRLYIAVDVSGSMWAGTIAGVPGLDPCKGAAVMAMVLAKMAPSHYVAGFSCAKGKALTWNNYQKTCSNDLMVQLNISHRKRLDDVVKVLRDVPMGNTDCSLPMRDALKRKIEADVFIILTDNETWSGNVHPMQALQEYRNKMQIPDAKLVVVAMTSTSYSIADPTDDRCLDVVGFDTAVPQLVQDFIG